MACLARDSLRRVWFTLFKENDTLLAAVETHLERWRDVVVMFHAIRAHSTPLPIQICCKYRSYVISLSETIICMVGLF